MAKDEPYKSGQDLPYAYCTWQRANNKYIKEGSGMAKEEPYKSRQDLPYANCTWQRANNKYIK